MGFAYLEKVIIEADVKEYQEINHKVGVIISHPEMDNNEEGFVLSTATNETYGFQIY